MMAMKCDVEGAPEVDLITKDEAFNVSFLTFINVHDDGEKFICFVPEFKVLAGKLHASVNLKHGDSGGPCFAILKNGEIRLCGVVSSGNPRRGGGNLITFCYHTGELSGNSSDEDDPNTLSAVTMFNKVRRVKFASDDPSKKDRICKSAVVDYLDGHSDEFRGMKDWTKKITWTMMKDDSDDVAEAMHVADWPRIEQQRSDEKKNDDGSSSDEGGGDGPPHSKKKGKRKDQKRRNKDRAYRKRAVGRAMRFGEKLKAVYSAKDAEAIFDTVMRGNVPQLSPRSFIVSTDGSNWVVSDEPQDNAWS
jgi:hypothetical protein